MGGPADIPADPDQLVSAFGRALSEISRHEAEHGVAAELAKIGPAIDLTWLEIWRVQRPTNTSVLLADWCADDAEPHEVAFFDATKSEQLSRALSRTGTAVVPREWVEAHGSSSRAAGDPNSLVISIVDREAGFEDGATETTVLIGVPRPRATLTLVTSVMSDLAVQLKQFNRRVRTEQRLEASVLLERTISSIARRLNRLDLDESSTLEALEELREGLGATAVMVSEYRGERTVEVTAIAAPDLSLQAPITFEVPAVDGVDVDALLRERIASRSTRTSQGMLEFAFGPEASAAFGELSDERSIVTAPVGTAGRAALGALRGMERPFSASELEALTSLGVLLGHARERLAAADAEQRRAAGAALLAEAGIDLADASPESMHDDLRSVLSRFADHLGFDGIGFFAVEAAAERYRTIASWEHHDAPYPRIPPYPAFGDRPHYDQARLTGEIHCAEPNSPHEGLSHRLAIPVGTGDRVDHLLVVGDGQADSHDPDVTRLLSAFARLLSHAVSRLEAERYADTAFRNSPVGIVIAESDGTVLAANQACVELMAATDEARLIGTSYRDFVQPRPNAIEWSVEPGLTIATMPIRSLDGRTWLARFENRRIPETSPERWLSHITDVTARQEAEAQLRYAATHDDLTGLPNRVALFEAIEAIDGDAALLLLDLDRFKHVNDSLGHARGDDLLATVADRLRLALRLDEFVVRLGGDEFAILLAEPADASSVAERVMRALSAPAMIGASQLFPSASIGVAVASSADPDVLMRRADVAMYRAKESGRNRTVVFDEDLQRTVDDRHRIETGLRAALADGQIEVHYQPEIDLMTGGVLGAEALVRWRQPDGSVTAAGEFIEIAEQAGLIHDIGQRVLDLACAEAATWPSGDDGPKIRVNLSAEQLHRDDLVATITRALAEHDLPAGRLCLEVTESAAMRDPDRSEAVLLELRALGVELAIDDFGTGYSSLAYLKRFPFHTLKIDRSFVIGLEDDPDDVAFVGSIIYLARSLGLEVIAEGIEAEGQAEALRGLGCTRGQGFHFARPAPAEVLRARLGG
ncbi:MAG: sensor domain-containing phosphodiesterase [Actinomycetota bacterium]